MRSRIAPAALAAVKRLQDAGFDAYLVGGCVRDLLRGEAPHDYDITTSARPEQTKQVFSDCRVVETGIRHGTVTVLTEGLPLEITTFRTDGTYSDGRHPDAVTFAQRIEDDLRRRDFTVNAMAYSPAAGLVDLFGGRDDLQKGIIRCVGDPRTRFSEDALRILRAARFASVLDFTVEPASAEAMVACTPLLAAVASERIASEWIRLLCGVGVERVLSAFRELIAFFIPELRPTFGFDQKTPHHCYDVFTHTVKVISAVPPEPTLRLAAFFHDLGKPAAFTCRDGRGHFKGHAEKSAQIAETVLRRLHTERTLIRDVCLLVREHDTFLKKKDGDVLRLLQRVPVGLVDPLLQLMRADALAKADPAPSLARTDSLRAEIAQVLQTAPCLSVSELAVGGGDLLALGVPEGKRVGELLRLLQEKVLRGELENDREELLHFLRKSFTDS